MKSLVRIFYRCALCCLLPCCVLSYTRDYPVAAAIDLPSQRASMFAVVFHKGAVIPFAAWSANYRGAILTVGGIGNHGFGSLRYGWSDKPMWLWPGRIGPTILVLGTSPASVDRGIAIPTWWLMIVLLVPLLITTTRTLRQKQRARRGLCAECGYDLRASPVRCPECGTVPK